VTARNLTTHETAEGPVWRFRTVAADAPVDSVELPLTDWTSYERNADTTVCFNARFPVGALWVAALRWPLAQLGPLKLSYVAIRVGYVSYYRYGISCYEARNYWAACDLRDLDVGYQIAQCRNIDQVIGRMYASSDTLTAHVEDNLRHGGFYGYVFSGPLEMTLLEKGSTMTLIYYKE
jgi:hypothetical protein